MASAGVPDLSKEQQKEAPKTAKSRFLAVCRSYTVENDPFIKSQLASRNKLWGQM
jgi:hypothetical protein